MHRFHGIWIDLEQDEFGGLSAQRLFSMIERLGAYDGALQARIYHIQQEEKQRNPSRAAVEKPGTVVVDDLSAVRELIGDMVEIEQV